MGLIEKIRKRNGAVVPFERQKIESAIIKAGIATGEFDEKTSVNLTNKIIQSINTDSVPTVESVQDAVITVLKESGFSITSKAYSDYRSKRADVRELEKKAEPDLDIDAQIELMFNHKSKLLKIVPKERIETYKTLYKYLRTIQREGKVPMHPDNNYLSGNELASDIYSRKYFLKNMAGNPVETRPEHVFTRLAAYMGAIETDVEKQKSWTKRFYEMLYEGHFMPGGRVIAGAGDLYRLKTLANCFVTVIKGDNLESIYAAAYDCARTYSYGGGIGVDISVLRPKDSVVHNAADQSTGSVSFMELYSLTTGLIGQSGRRGALMLTVDCKHPDVSDFIKVKKVPNWVTKQVIEQCSWSGKFDDEQLKEIGKQVRENTQVRFANISLKVSDEFMQAVSEQTDYGNDSIVVYKKLSVNGEPIAQDGDLNYSHGIPSRDISKYDFVDKFDSVDDVNKAIGSDFTSADLDDIQKRNTFGDLIVKGTDGNYAIRVSGDFMLYFSSPQTGEIRRLVKAREIWNNFVSGNYSTAEPGLLFWSTMTKYSPSNYIDKPIASTNPCGEVPLEDGGACNLASVNLSRMVVDGYSKNAKLDWDLIEKTTKDLTRFLDNVITWNEMLNPLEKQRNAAKETRRIGIGVMGIADMMYQMGIGYDSKEGIALIEKIGKFMADVSYVASAELAGEKGPSPIFDYEKYKECAFFKERLDESTKELVKKHGLRNIALLSIAPTGSISNIVLSYKNGKKNYVGVSGGIEPVFSLFYTRRSESFGNKMFKLFHSTVQAFIDKNGLQDKIQQAKGLDEMRHVLPSYFFRTAHFIEPLMRVQIQGIFQKYIDHSISSTVNLPESIEPEVISKIYLDAWKNGLKGITIYRDGSRYPILSVEKKQTEFQAIKGKLFTVTMNGKEAVYTGDEVFTAPDDTLTTPFHAMDKNMPGVTIKETGSSGFVVDDKKSDDDEDHPGTCKIKIVDGQVVKSCSE